LNAPIGWWWPVLAGVATVTALLVGSNYAVAVPAATVAVVAAALALVGPLRLRRVEKRPPTYLPAVHVGSVRAALNGGEPGREDLVLTLDLLERRISRPDLPAKSAAEITALVRQPAAEFREYVNRRLDELETLS
jgi:hypothetical protein